MLSSMTRTCASTGSTIVNSNSSEYCLLDERSNFVRTAYYPSLGTFGTTASATTLDTKGSNLEYPEVIYVSDSANAINYTALSDAAQGRKLTIIPLADNLVIRHEQGTAGVNGQFVLSTAATTTLDVGSAISFVANDNNQWLEIGRNVQVT